MNKMYAVMNAENGKMMGVKLSENEAYELRDTFLNWEDMVVEWMDTEADVLLERIRDRHADVADFSVDNKHDITYRFSKNTNGEIESFELLGRYGETLMSVNIISMTVTMFNDAILINNSMTIKVSDLVLE